MALVYLVLLLFLSGLLQALLPEGWPAPDLFLVYALWLAASRPPLLGLALAFLVGLLQDLLGFGLLGLHAVGLLLAAYAYYGAARYLDLRSPAGALAAFALAQAPKPLKVGELTGEALYPGNRGVSYGEVGLVARGLGLALWQGEGQVALGLGARYRTFPVEADEAKAASSLAAWRKDGRVYVPLRPLADALGLSYQAQVGIQLDLPWARLLQVEARPEGYLLRFSREVNAVVRPGGVLFLMAQGSHPSLVQEAMGLFLPLSRPPERVYYPGGGQVAVGLTPLPLPSPTVLLDPGHGGEDPGLEVQGLAEKEVALDLARRVAARKFWRRARMSDLSIALAMSGMSGLRIGSTEGPDQISEETADRLADATAPAYIQDEDGHRHFFDLCPV